ncbi:MAG: MFS transporter [Candidatus Margulisiibacteriota bacterium]
MNSPHKKSLFILFLVVATELIGFGLLIPILPQIASQFQVSPFLIGFLLASYSLAQFVAAPVLGALSDKFGRKPLLVISKVGSVLAYVLLANAHTYALFLISRLLDGFTGGNISVARAYVGDITSPEDRPKGMAVIGIAFGTGFILGPALGGILFGISNGHALPAWVAGGFSAVATLITVLFLKEPESRKKSESALESLKALPTRLTSRPVRIICLTQMVYMILFSGFETSFSAFTHRVFGYTTQQNSWLFVFVGLMMLVVQGGITRRATRNLKRMVGVGLSITALSVFGLSMAHGLGMLLVSLAALALGVGLVNAYMPSLLSGFAHADSRGALMGLYEGLGSLSRIIGPLGAFGFVLLYTRLSYFAFGLVLVLATVGFVLLLKPTSPELSQDA